MKKKHSRDRLTVRDDTQRDPEYSEGSGSDIRKNGGRLLSTEARSQPNPHHGLGKSHQIPRRANYTDCGPDHIKIMQNSVLSTKDAKYMCIDIKNFYVGTPLDRFEYMRIPLSMFPDHVAQQYQLREKEKNRFNYVEIREAIYGLPQAGVLSNKLLNKRLAPV